MNGTIQQQLKELFYSLGGNADDVRDLDDPGAIIEAILSIAYINQTSAPRPVYGTSP